MKHREGTLRQTWHDTHTHRLAKSHIARKKELINRERKSKISQANLISNKDDTRCHWIYFFYFIFLLCSLVLIGMLHSGARGRNWQRNVASCSTCCCCSTWLLFPLLALVIALTVSASFEPRRFDCQLTNAALCKFLLLLLLLLFLVALRCAATYTIKNKDENLFTSLAAGFAFAFAVAIAVAVIVLFVVAYPGPFPALWV